MTFAQCATETARQHITSCLLTLKKRSAAAKTPAAARKTCGCWRETPEPFRKLLARSAGLSLDVVSKFDRDLTETEKTMIRSAAARLKERADALVAL
jgi:hypothetical protein